MEQSWGLSLQNDSGRTTRKWWLPRRHDQEQVDKRQHPSRWNIPPLHFLRAHNCQRFLLIEAEDYLRCRSTLHRHPSISSRLTNLFGLFLEPILDLSHGPPSIMARTQYGDDVWGIALRSGLWRVVVLRSRFWCQPSWLGCGSLRLLHHGLLHAWLHGWKAVEENGNKQSFGSVIVSHNVSNVLEFGLIFLFTSVDAFPWMGLAWRLHILTSSKHHCEVT